MTEKVSVRITGQQTVQYDQIVEMDRDEYERLSEALEADTGRERRRAEENVFSLWIDTRDICDADDFELDDFILCDGEEE